MKDERILKEMNQIKGIVCLYVLIATLILGLLKYLIYGFDFNYYFVEIYILSISLMMFTIVLFNRMKTYDERIDQNIKKIYQYGFLVLFIGGLWVHFYQVSVNFQSQIFIGYITNTLILIGFIVTLILLKRKGLYANYRFIEYSKAQYYKHIALNVGFILLIFIGIFASIYGLFLMSSEVAIFIALIAISFFMISIEYILFSIYEKNHYDEMIYFENRNPNILSKNVFLLQIVVFIFTVIMTYVNLRLTLIHLENSFENREAFIMWTVINQVIQMMSIDFHILGLIMIIIAYRYLVKLLGKSFFLKVFLIVGVIGFLHRLFNYVFSLLSPFYDQLFESTEQIINMIRIISQTSLIISIVLTSFYVFMGILLFVKDVAYKKLVLSYVIFMILTNQYVISFIFKISSRSYFITNFTLSTMSNTFVLVISGLFAYTTYKSYQQNLNQEFSEA